LLINVRRYPTLYEHFASYSKTLEFE